MGNAKRARLIAILAGMLRLAPNVTPPTLSSTLLVWTPAQWVTSNTMECVNPAVPIVTTVLMLLHAKSAIRISS